MIDDWHGEPPITNHCLDLLPILPSRRPRAHQKGMDYGYGR